MMTAVPFLLHMLKSQWNERIESFVVILFFLLLLLLYVINTEKPKTGKKVMINTENNKEYTWIKMIYVDI